MVIGLLRIDPIWHKIAEAYELVSKDSSREITVEMNGMKAVVGYADVSAKWKPCVIITITEIPEEKPILIQP